MQKGYSIIEILVVIVIFSILTLVTTQTIFLTIRGSNKSSASIEVRENVDFAISTIERRLRNAQHIECLNASGDPVWEIGTRELEFTNEDGEKISFSCVGEDEGRITVGSASARLTSEDVFIDCSTTTEVFVCSQSSSLDSVEINLTARDEKEAGAEGSTVSVSTKVMLRSY